ncbi:hypothetical protein GT347_04320 [Xylophilus rhododendri]|uniref:Uncharacterized protein n=1 Tax=Xylophilus rhododendri TaxID=2697032 RepID=A0A857J213_9BURK|nr:hypothetical protein [Xylophilus rhododendri]QHI97273.1 hypothetical protein GT347_04320 [Xylophilus rhododendri]
MNSRLGNPEFPAADPALADEDDLDSDDLPEQVEAPSPGEGLVEPAGVPFDEEVERVVQPEPVGD